MAQPVRTEAAFEGVVPCPHENPPVPSVKDRALAALQHCCERCGAYPAERQPCRTCYSDHKENIAPMLCPACAEEYNDYWDEMWADYYSGSGVVHVTKEQLKALRVK